MRLPSAGLVATQILVACGVLALILLVHGGWWGFAEGFDPACLQPVCDFNKHYLPTSAALAEQGRPTWGYVYPATLAILTWPLSVSPQLGSAAWGVLLVAVQLVLAVLPPHLVRDTSPRLAVAFSGASMLAVATLQVLSWGQVSGVLLLAGLLAFFVVDRRPGLAGGLIGLGIALKLYPVLLLPWLLLRGRWRGLAGVLGVGAVLAVGLPMLVLGPSGAAAFHVHVYAEIQRLIPDFQRSIGPQSALSVTERLLFGAPTSLRPWLRVAYAGLGLAQLALLVPIGRRRGHDAWLWAFVVCYGTFPLLLASSWLHYFVHLPLVWLLLARSLSMERPRLRLGVAVCGGLSAALAVWPLWVALGPVLYPALGVMLASHLVGLLGMLLVLLGGEDAELSGRSVVPW